MVMIGGPPHLFDLPHPEEFGMFAERTLDVVEKDVRLKDATLPDAEAQFPQLLAGFIKLAPQAQPNFDFDLQSHTLKHAGSACQAQNGPAQNGPGVNVRWQCCS